MKIQHYSRLEIESGIDIPQNSVIISIGEPGLPRANLDSYPNDKFFFDFWDVEYPVQIVGGGIAETITPEQAQEIYEVLRLGEDVVCHCRMGKSRSAAICKFAQDYLDYEWSGKDNPRNKPNPLVYSSLIKAANKIYSS